MEDIENKFWLLCKKIMREARAPNQTNQLIDLFLKNMLHTIM